MRMRHRYLYTAQVVAEKVHERLWNYVGMNVEVIAVDSEDEMERRISEDREGDESRNIEKGCFIGGSG